MFEGALLNTIKIVFVKIELHMDCKVLHSKLHIFIKTLVPFCIKSLFSRTWIFHGCVKKIIINIAENKFCLFNMQLQPN